VILELSALFTKDREIAPMIFKTPAIIHYVFEKLTSRYAHGNFLAEKSIRDIVRISALALCRLAASLDEQNHTFFIEELKQPNFDNFKTVMENIPAMIALTAEEES
jgi:hypothetical protein